MSLQVLSSGMYTTIQDKGRFGHQHIGIPVSGAMDLEAFTLANLLVGNTTANAVLEMAVVGGTFKALKQVSLAITGANMEPKINNNVVPMHKVLFLKKGDVLSFSKAINGVYAYVGFPNGINIPKYWGSFATYVPAKLGGLTGETLKKGTIIPLQKHKLQINNRVKLSCYKNKVELNCLKGPEWNLFNKKNKILFLTQTYTVSKNSNRIGIRLKGSSIVSAQKEELISSGIVKGTVQVTNAGQLIVMMADAPTVGGYFRIVNLTESAINQIAQVQEGGSISFKLI